MKNLSKQIAEFMKLVLVLALIVLIAVLSFIILDTLHLKMDGTTWMTFVLAVGTVGVIWWQGRQLQKQLELQTITELYKEWNGDEMRKARHELCLLLSFDREIYDLDRVEDVLEFLERIASFYKDKVLSKELIWATIGWYIMRYFYYARELSTITGIRKKWSGDKTLYKEIERLYKDLLDMELCLRREEGEPIKNEKEIEQQFKIELEKFKESERNEKSEKRP